VTPILPRARWAMVDAFKHFEGPDRALYTPVLGWRADGDEGPPYDVPGLPVDCTGEGLGWFFTHAGRDWILMEKAPEIRYPPVPGQ
jgi:hypothetical protein